MITSKEIVELFQNQYQRLDSDLVFKVRPSDGNVSISYSSKRGTVFAYIDFVKGEAVARLKITPNHFKLDNYKGIWKNYTGKHPIGSWEDQVIEIVMNDTNLIMKYINIFEIVKEYNKN